MAKNKYWITYTHGFNFPQGSWDQREVEYPPGIKSRDDIDKVIKKIEKEFCCRLVKIMGWGKFD